MMFHNYQRKTIAIVYRKREKNHKFLFFLHHYYVAYQNKNISNFKINIFVDLEYVSVYILSSKQNFHFAIVII